MPQVVVKHLLAGINRLFCEIGVCHKNAPEAFESVCSCAYYSGAHNLLGNCNVFSYNTVVRAGAAGMLEAFLVAEWEMRCAEAYVNLRITLTHFKLFGVKNMLAKKLLYSAVFALAIGVTAGCQSSPSAEELAEVRAMAEEALHTAKSAAQDAAAAKACCEANTERMDRMFHDSMMKSK